MNTTASRPATQKQFDFLKKLIAERELDAELENWVFSARHFAQVGTFSAEAASQLIDALLAAPRKGSETVKAGVYRLSDGMLVRVYLGQQSGQMLAKEILIDEQGHVEYAYIGSARRVIHEAHSDRLSVEEVGQLGITTGTCLVCGRRLDDPESVDRGIGPVCAANY